MKKISFNIIFFLLVMVGLSVSGAQQAFATNTNICTPAAAGQPSMQCTNATLPDFYYGTSPAGYSCRARYSDAENGGLCTGTPPTGGIRTFTCNSGCGIGCPVGQSQVGGVCIANCQWYEKRLNDNTCKSFFHIIKDGDIYKLISEEVKAVVSQLVTVPAGGCGNNQIPKWNGSAWACADLPSSAIGNNSVASANIEDNTITADDLAADSVTTDEIDDGSVQFPDFGMSCTNGQVMQSNGTGWACGNSLWTDATSFIYTTGNVSIGAASSTAKLSVIGTSNFAGNMVLNGSLTVSATGTNNVDFPPGVINASELASSSVTSAKIAENAVSGASIIDGTISALDIYDGGVGSAEIAQGAVGESEIAANSVGNSEFAHYLATESTDVLTSTDPEGYATSYCETGEAVLSGSCWATETSGVSDAVYMTGMYSVFNSTLNKTGWRCRGFNTLNASITLHAKAWCLP